MENILIMMSTYNGDQFIVDQLNSIFNQKQVNIHLLVRDDGSKDNTVEILNDYKIHHENQMTIIIGNNIGWKKSFFKLLEIAYKDYKEYKYYAFSDQDDIWEENKLFIAINKLIQLPIGPRLYCSNLTYYKDETIYNPIYLSPPQITVKTCLMRNYATGCTIVFNRPLLVLINKKSVSIDIAHDYWTYMVATICGSVFFDMNSHILYRQHANNQIGFKYGFKNQWKRRIREVKSLLYDHKKENQAKELLEIYASNMSDINRKAVEKLASYNTSIRNKYELLRDREFSTNNLTSDRWNIVKIIFGLI